jgi:hypothetical protein
MKATPEIEQIVAAWQLQKLQLVGVPRDTGGRKGQPLGQGLPQEATPRKVHGKAGTGHEGGRKPWSA